MNDYGLNKIVLKRSSKTQIQTNLTLFMYHQEINKYIPSTANTFEFWRILGKNYTKQGYKD